MEDDFSLLIASYLEDNAALVKQLQTNIGHYEEADIRKAHSLKSTSLNIGAVAVAEIAKQLEQQLKEGGAISEAQWSNLSQKFESTAERLQKMVC